MATLTHARPSTNGHHKNGVPGNGVERFARSLDRALNRFSRRDDKAGAKKALLALWAFLGACRDLEDAFGPLCNLHPQVGLPHWRHILEGLGEDLASEVGNANTLEQLFGP